MEALAGNNFVAQFRHIIPLSLIQVGLGLEGHRRVLGSASQIGLGPAFGEACDGVRKVRFNGGPYLRRSCGLLGRKLVGAHYVGDDRHVAEHRHEPEVCVCADEFAVAYTLIGSFLVDIFLEFVFEHAHLGNGVVGGGNYIVPGLPLGRDELVGGIVFKLVHLLGGCAVFGSGTLVGIVGSDFQAAYIRE